MANEVKEAPKEAPKEEGKGIDFEAKLGQAQPGGINLERLLNKAETRIDCLVLGAEAWAFEEKNIKGTKVHWCELGAAETDKRRGWVPKVSKSQDFDAFHQLREFALPAYFSAKCTVIKDGVALSEFRHIADLEAS